MIANFTSCSDVDNPSLLLKRIKKSKDLHAGDISITVFDLRM